MDLLLDTHALLWWLFDDPKLSKNARRHLSDPQNTILVSAASIWEITTKHRLGKLNEAGDVPDQIEDYIMRSGFKELSISLGHAAQAGRMAITHKDPFDRILITQSNIEQLPVVTTDQQIAKHAKTLW